MVEAEELENLRSPFSGAELEELNGLRFKRKSLERLLKERCNLESGFHRYLLRLEQPLALAFNKLMTAFDGDPSGVEFKCRKSERWAFVLEDASEQGRFRIQYFDVNGFVSHQSYDSIWECVENLVSEGYLIEDRGAMDRLSETDAWRRGVEVAGLMQKLNYKQITYAEFCEKVAAL